MRYKIKIEKEYQTIATSRKEAIKKVQNKLLEECMSAKGIEEVFKIKTYINPEEFTTRE